MVSWYLGEKNPVAYPGTDRTTPSWTTPGVPVVVLQSHLKRSETNAVLFASYSFPRVWEYSVGPVTLARSELVELPQGYELEEMGQNLLLKRPNGYVLAAFRQGIKPENIRRVAEADQKYLRAAEREERFSLGADPETVLMFSEDVKEARTEFLLALEVAYRGKDA